MVKLARRTEIKTGAKKLQLRNPCNHVQLRWPPSHAHVLVLPKRYEKILCIQDWRLEEPKKETGQVNRRGVVRKKRREGNEKSDEGNDY